MPKFRKLPVVVEAVPLEEDFTVATLEGNMRGKKGDMLITGVEGEQYICKKRIFEKTYELAETCFVDLCFDFDGVLHQYTQGWLGTDVIPDPPVPGAIKKLHHYLSKGYTIAIFSARSGQQGGVAAMRKWVDTWDHAWRTTEGHTQDDYLKNRLIDRIEFPTHKPAAKVYIDDRGLRFDGEWFDEETLKAAMVPWYERSDTDTNVFAPEKEYAGYLGKGHVRHAEHNNRLVNFLYLPHDISVKQMREQAQKGANQFDEAVTLVRYGKPNEIFYPQAQQED